MKINLKKGYKKNISRSIDWFRRTRMRNKLLVLFFLVASLAIVYRVAFSGNNSDGYNFETVRRGDIVQVVKESGEIRAAGEVPVYSPSNGVVQEVFVENGDEIVHGQNLFSVVSTATEQEKAASYATYLQAKTTLDAANASKFSLQSQMFSAWETFRDYAEDHEDAEERELAEFHILEKNWLAAETSFKNQQAVVSQAQAALNAAWLSYQATQDSIVKATAYGTAANVSVSPFSQVRVYSPTDVSPPALTIANFSATDVVVPLRENDIFKINQGQEAEIDVKAIDERKYRGVVRRVDAIGREIEGVTIYNAYIEVLDADRQIRPGMTADVRITTDKLEDVLVVSNSSVKPYQGGRAVRVLSSEGDIEFVPIRIGVRGETLTQILDGISEGETVIKAIANEQNSRPSLF